MISLSIFEVLSSGTRVLTLRCVLIAWRSDRRSYNSLLRHATLQDIYIFLAVSWERTSCRTQSVDTFLSRCSVSYDNFVDRSVFSCLVSIKLATQTPSCESLSTPILMANYMAWRDTALPYRSFVMDHIFLIASGIIDDLHNSASFILHAHEARSICWISFLLPFTKTACIFLTLLLFNF